MTRKRSRRVVHEEAKAWGFAGRLFTGIPPRVMALLFSIFLLHGFDFGFAQTILESDFGTSNTPLKNAAGGTPNRVEGVVPEGWKDESILSTGTVKTSVVEEGGKKFLRYDVSNSHKEVAQLAFQPLPAITEEGSYACTLKVRNVSPERIRPYIRPITGMQRISWTQLPILTKEWQTFTWYFSLRPSTLPYGFWLQFYGSGQIDLESVKIEKLTQEELASRWKGAHPAETVANLFRNSRFPLGLQSGWSVGRNDADGGAPMIAGDLNTPGPTGSLSLAIQSKQAVTIFSEPFTVSNPVEPQQVTLSIKGSGAWKFAVGESGGWDEGTEITLKDGADWQRIHVPFQSRLNEKARVIRIQGTGKLWLDGAARGSCRRGGRLREPGRLRSSSRDS